jgi:hypothetical protein
VDRPYPSSPTRKTTANLLDSTRARVLTPGAMIGGVQVIERAKGLALRRFQA